VFGALTKSAQGISKVPVLARVANWTARWRADNNDLVVDKKWINRGQERCHGLFHFPLVHNTTVAHLNLNDMFR
jgi:hypothetical protein